MGHSEVRSISARPARAARSTLAVLVAGALGIGLSLTGQAPAAKAQAPAVPGDDSAYGPVVLGGRIEVPSQGFALTPPADWYALDLTHPDLRTRMEAFDEDTAMLAPLIGSLNAVNLRPDLVSANPRLLEQVTLALVAFPPGANGACTVAVQPVESDVPDRVLGSALATLAAYENLVGDAEGSLVELPAGTAARVDYTARVGGALETSTSFALARGDVAYAITCSAAVRPAVGWQSIAETFEFLSPQDSTRPSGDPRVSPLPVTGQALDPTPRASPERRSIPTATVSPSPDGVVSSLLSYVPLRDCEEQVPSRSDLGAVAEIACAVSGSDARVTYILFDSITGLRAWWRIESLVATTHTNGLERCSAGREAEFAWDAPFDLSRGRALCYYFRVVDEPPNAQLAWTDESLLIGVYVDGNTCDMRALVEWWRSGAASPVQ